VDSNGKAAVEFFGDFRFDHEGQREAFYGLMNYMSVQKLRTPKGLGVLSSMPGGKDHASRLMLLQSIQDRGRHPIRHQVHNLRPPCYGLQSQVLPWLRLLQGVQRPRHPHGRNAHLLSPVP
jgi:hypothetical protein